MEIESLESIESIESIGSILVFKLFMSFSWMIGPSDQSVLSGPEFSDDAFTCTNVHTTS